jgi:hypothetical protein
VQFAQTNFALANIDDGSCDLAAAAVKHHKLLADFQAQNIAGVMRFCPAQNQRIRIPILRRNVETVHPVTQASSLSRQVRILRARRASGWKPVRRFRQDA